MLKLNFNFILVPLAVASAWAAPAPVTRARYLMGTVCEIQVYAQSRAQADAAIEGAFEEINRLENILSTWRPESEVSRLNRLQPLAPMPCSAELAEIIGLSQKISQITSGAFDITIKPLLDAWGLQAQSRVPTPAEIQAAVERTGWRLLKVQNRAISFQRKGMGLDFGAVGKGYALDRAASVLKAHAVHAALLNFGGQILAVGQPPGQKAWQIHLGLLTIPLKNQSASTSSQREARASGKHSGHILDPRTGKPASFEGSVTVIANSAAQADALSTAFFVMGEDQAKKVLKKLPGIKAIFLAPEQTLSKGEKK